MNMSGSQRTAPLDAYIQRIEEEEKRKAMIAAKEKLAQFPSPPVVVEAERVKPTSRFDLGRKHKPGQSPVQQYNRFFSESNVPQVQRNLASGKASADKILNTLTQPQHAPTVTSINSVNAGFGQGNPSLKTPPGSPAAPIIPVGSRARHHPGFDQYAYTGKPNRDNPFSSKLLADLRKPEEDEFMSWDDQMFLLSLMEGMQGGDPPTPYGAAYGGGNKAWATPLGMS